MNLKRDKCVPCEKEVWLMVYYHCTRNLKSTLNILADHIILIKLKDT